ncbi:MAG TPA: DsbA family protein [Thermoleophilaceae bacterium]|nr:DsbA family protein [Thermoleophilaceae bacterium]
MNQDGQPVFYYDLASPYAYLAAERIHEVLPVTPVWQPILLGGIWQQTGGGSWAVTDARQEGMAEIERRAAERGLLPIRWPEPWPGNSLYAMRAATFAQQIGRVVAFSLAAFRQAFAGGRDLSDVDNVVIAAAACELHPNALLKAIESQSVKDRLKEATAEAYERGVRGVPSVAVGDQVFWGDDRLEEAAAAIANG